MAGKSPVVASEEQRRELGALSHSRDRGEADRARAIVLTLLGWTSGPIAEAFGVREDTVRFWRSVFMTGGVEALKTSVAPGPAPVKAARALAVAEEVLSGPVADRPNWTLPRWWPIARTGRCRVGGRSPELDAAALVADRPNWTLPRLADEIERRAGVRISRSRLSVVLRQRGISAGGDPATR
jgi:transposase